MCRRDTNNQAEVFIIVVLALVQSLCVFSTQNSKGHIGNAQLIFVKWQVNMYVCMYMFKCFLLRRCSDQKKKKKRETLL